jgi:hypothetical protein
MVRWLVSATLGLTALASISSGSNAAPVLGPAQITSDSSAIVQVDRRCGPGRHLIPRHRVRGRDGRLHWVGGYCARNRRY